MGCDIHFRVEYYGPEETVVLENGALSVRMDGESRWHPAERLSPSKYRKMWEDQLALPPEKRSGNATDEQLREWIEEEPKLALDYDDRFYTGRNYGLFWMLTGTRGPQEGAIPIPVQLGETTLEDISSNWGYGRGIPEDVCPEVGEELAEDDGDLHTHSWYTLDELLNADWSEATYPMADGQRMPYFASGFDQTLLLMQAVAIEKCGGDTTRVRAVFAYDN